MEKNVGGVFSALRIVGGFLMQGVSLWVAYFGWMAGSPGWMMVATGTVMGAGLVVTGVLHRRPMNASRHLGPGR